MTLCQTCGIRETTGGGNYCDKCRPSAGTVTKLSAGTLTEFIDGHLSLTELRQALTLIEDTGYRLINLSAASVQESGQEKLVTSASFEPLSSENLPPTSELEIREVGSESDTASMIAMQLSKGYRLVTRSSAYVQGKLTKILVFRR